MKLVRQWEINYNGGVIRFTPAGETEQIVIWQTSDMTSQQHSSSATFSAPTTDGRQAWLNISNDGKINGGGYHGATADSYLRCGDAQTGVERIGLQVKDIACRFGARLDENGNPDYDADFQYTYETSRIEYDFSVFPFKSIVNLTHPEYSLGDYDADQDGFQTGVTFNGELVTALFYRHGANPPYYYFIDEELVGAIAGGRFAFQTGWECGNF